MRRLIFCLFPIVLAAQTPAATAPPEVDKALRDRVNEFYGYHVTGEFRKAFNLVAEDTQDYYFGAGKMKFTECKLDSVKYLNTEFTRAEVVNTCTREWEFQPGKRMPSTTPIPTIWKIENGKWVWTYDAMLANRTPMGLSAQVPERTARTVEPPKDLSQDALKAMASQILKQVSADKKEVELPADRPGYAEVLITNELPGAVTLELNLPKPPNGLSVQFDKIQLVSGEKARMMVSWRPRDKEARTNVLAQIIVSPFGKILPVTIRFVADKTAQNSQAQK